MADPLDDLDTSFRNALRSAGTTAQKMMSATKQAVSQGYDQLKATPQNLSTVNEALKSVAPNAEIRPPDAWDLGSAYNQAKSAITGFWRGYVAPHLR